MATAASSGSLMFKSPIGWMEIAATEEGICAVRFVGRHGRGTMHRAPTICALHLRRGMPWHAPTSVSKELLKKCTRELREYFTGRRRAFSVPVVLRGTDFERRMWSALRRIPSGHTVTYGELARRAGFPRAARAVGSAMRRNPLCILVPCHRVVPASPHGAIGQYGAGVEKKRWLIAHEAGRMVQ